MVKFLENAKVLHVVIPMELKFGPLNVYSMMYVVE